MTKKKVAVISSYYQNWNMGGLLQAYALNRAIRDLGYDAAHIRLCYTEPADADSALSARVRTVLTRHRLSSELIERFFTYRQHESRNRKSFRDFHDHAIPGSVACSDAITAEKLNRHYDIFVTGSDQIWNPKFWSNRLLGVFGLLFAAPGKRTLSYAASIGSEQAVAGKEEIFRTILEKLDYVSVREAAAQTCLQPLTDKPVHVVADPTLLLTPSDWAEETAERQADVPYLFAYFLEEETKHNAQLHVAAEQLSLPVYCISTEKGQYVRPGKDCQICDAGPREFLSYIRNAEMIVTNSFHGMVFSVVFQKPFWVVKRYRDTDKASANNRITDFLRMLGLEDRLIADDDMPDAEQLRRSIDYSRVSKRLEDLRADSLAWLKNALKTE